MDDFCWEKCKKSDFEHPETAIEFNSFSPNKTVAHCTIWRLLARHNLIGWAAANKLTLKKLIAKTRQERLRWADSRYAATVGFRSAEVRMKNTTLAVRYHAPAIGNSFLAFHCLQWYGTPRQNARKMQIVGLCPHFGTNRSRNWNKNLVDDNCPTDRTHAVNEWTS